MPNLLNFIRGNGTLMTNDHTVLISHTANGILTNLTGCTPTATARRSRTRTATSGRTARPGRRRRSSTGRTSTRQRQPPPTDPNYNMVNGDSGTPKNAPAPWVPYTRAGCDFGATALANVVLENTGDRPERRHDEGLRRGVARVERGAGLKRSPAGTAARTWRRPTSSAWRSTAPRRRQHLRRQRARPARSAARRARRLQRLQGRSSARSTSTRRSPAATPP